MFAGLVAHDEEAEDFWRGHFEHFFGADRGAFAAVHGALSFEEDEFVDE